MNIKSEQMYKKINFFNFFIAIIGTTVIYFFDEKHALSFLLGLVLASITLLFNLMYVSNVLGKTKIKYRVITSIGFALRVVIVCVIGLMVFEYYKFAIIAYILGYSSQLISLVLYGINIKEGEGK